MRILHSSRLRVIESNNEALDASSPQRSEDLFTDPGAVASKTPQPFEEKIQVLMAVDAGVKEALGLSEHHAPFLTYELFDALKSVARTEISQGRSVEETARKVATEMNHSPEIQHQLVKSEFKMHYGVDMPQRIQEVVAGWSEKMEARPLQQKLEYFRYQLQGNAKPSWLDALAEIPDDYLGLVRLEDFPVPPKNAPTGANTSRVPFYSQLDPQWANQKMTFNKIADKGCALTAASMVLSASGQGVTPKELNALRPYQGERLIWECVGMKAEAFSLPNIDAQLKRGRPVVVGVRYGRSNTTQHWVTVTAKGVDDKGQTFYSALDPAASRSGEFRFYPSKSGHLIGTSVGKKYSTTQTLRVLSDSTVTLKDKRAIAPIDTQSLISEVTELNPLNRKAGADIHPNNGIDIQGLRALAPKLSDDQASQYVAHLNAAMGEFGILQQEEVETFLRWVGASSESFTRFQSRTDGVENEGIEALGNDYPGDGLRFKPRGAVPIQGRREYINASNALGENLVGEPELAATPAIAFRIAAWQFTLQKDGASNIENLESSRELPEKAGLLPFLSFHADRVACNTGIENWVLFHLSRAMLTDNHSRRAIEEATQKSPSFAEYSQRLGLTSDNALASYTLDCLARVHLPQKSLLDWAALLAKTPNEDAKQELLERLLKELQGPVVTPLPARVFRG